MQGPDHRIIFSVDEVGQFIGGDTHLMLDLQTITEDLGTACGGRAWVVVTSQEDIDAVLGDLRTTKSHDFSKIQGRFKTRLSLSSANVDEVIQERLLAKDDGVSIQLEDIFREKGDILRNQLSFRDVGMTFKQYRDSDDFVRNYPFAPYQFQLVQKIFEAIRKAGATGLHLSRGERSILDAFQSAGKAIAEQETGVLVPLYLFYPSIESFLDTAVKKTIDQAADNASLKPFDVEILRVLFLIRYVDEVKGNVDNLVTLCIDQIDADRLAIKKQIEESLVRLEKETLINRSGDNYFFLTNEERDINREIKSVELSSTEEAKLLGEIIFDDALKGSRKYRYPANKMDFSFNRMCDGFPYGSRVDKDLTVQVYTPLGETDTELFEHSRFQRESSQNDGQVVIKIDDDPSLGRELRQYLQTDKYLRSKSDDTLPEPTKRIHRAMAEDNRVRRDRLKNLLSNLMSDATYFAAGQKVEVKSSTPQTALDEALEYLVDNSFSKMDHITRLSDEPKQELQAIIRANDIQKAAMEGVNEKALEDLRGYIQLCHQTSRPIVLFDLVERFEKRPYGWPDMETLILLARLLVLGEIHFVTNGAALQLDKVYENITAPRKQRSITVVRRKTTDPKVLQDARKLGKEVFGETGPDSEDGLFEFLKGKCHAWKSSLSNYKTLADTGTYPGREKIDEGSDLLANLLAADEPAKMIERFLENKDDCLDLADNFHVIDNFYSKQKPTWEKLRKSAQRLNLNRFELDADESARKALDRMEQILKAPSPYGILQEADGLISTAEAVNRQIVDQRRQSALRHINELHSQVLAELESAGADDRLKANSTGPLEELRDNVATQESVAHIAQAVQRAEEARDSALKLIDEFVAKKATESSGGSESPKPVIKPRCEIRPSVLVAKTYLETKDDADAFIDKLRSEIVAAIAAGKRVQIR
ncbi:MAG: BREX system P-loop protein BrxC [Pirellulaceae bacterium]